jgi:hypothetical protein
MFGNALLGKKNTMNVIYEATKRRLSISALVLAVSIGTASAAGSGKLIFNGKVASTDVRTVNGSAYVKLSDMATALGMTVIKRGDGYEIIKKGGANQAGDLQGKMGDTLFDGRWRFAVLSMETADSYTMKTSGEPDDRTDDTTYNSVQRTLRPRSGNTLVILHCRAINGQKTEETLWVGARPDRHTALATTEGESYPPAAIDFPGAPSQSKRLLPGSKLDFPIVFSIPTSAEVKDLVFTLTNNNLSQKPNDARISLKAP